MEKETIIMIELVAIILIVFGYRRKVTNMNHRIKLLSDISHPNSSFRTEALSVVNIEKIPIKVLKQSERHIKEHYRRLVEYWWSLVGIGTYYEELNQFPDKKKSDFLMSILTQAADDVPLGAYVAMFIKNIIGNINANNRIFYGKIEIGKEFIIKVILNKSAHDFYEKLTKDINSLLNTNDGFTDEEKIVIQSELIQIRKMLQL